MMEFLTICRFFIIVMPSFSKFTISQRGSQQLVDSDGYIYSNKKSYNKETATFWRCSKYNPPTKCTVTCRLLLPGQRLVLNNPDNAHNHPAIIGQHEKKELVRSLKRKAADQQLTFTQNLLYEIKVNRALQTFPFIPSVKMNFEPCNPPLIDPLYLSGVSFLTDDLEPITLCQEDLKIQLFSEKMSPIRLVPVRTHSSTVPSFSPHSSTHQSYP